MVVFNIKICDVTCQLILKKKIIIFLSRWLMPNHNPIIYKNIQHLPRCQQVLYTTAEKKKKKKNFTATSPATNHH